MKMGDIFIAPLVIPESAQRLSGTAANAFAVAPAFPAVPARRFAPAGMTVVFWAAMTACEDMI